MSTEAPSKDRTFTSDDPAVHPGWALVEFLLSIGADEFSLSLIHCGDEGKSVCDRLAGTLAFASLGERTRECTVTYGGQGNPRPIEVWRLDQRSLEALRQVMPGILSSGDRSLAWAEDLCVYRRGALILGTVTHEQFAFLRISDDEWNAWTTVASPGAKRPRRSRWRLALRVHVMASYAWMLCYAPGLVQRMRTDALPPMEIVGVLIGFLLAPVFAPVMLYAAPFVAVWQGRPVMPAYFVGLAAYSAVAVTTYWIGSWREVPTASEATHS
jgi:hypothetical protein